LFLLPWLAFQFLPIDFYRVYKPFILKDLCLWFARAGFVYCYCRSLFQLAIGPPIIWLLVTFAMACTARALVSFRSALPGMLFPGALQFV